MQGVRWWLLGFWISMGAAWATTPLVYVRYPRVGPVPTADGSGWYGNRYDEPFFSWPNRCFGTPGDTGMPSCPAGYRIPENPNLPEVRDLYRVIPGGDLVLRRSDGSERVLLDHDESAPVGIAVSSVLDLAVSPDAQWIAYAEVANARASVNEAGLGSRIDLKIMYVGDETDPRFAVPVCLSCSLDYDFRRFKGWSPTQDESAVRNLVRGPVFVAPLWLPDGRIVFGSTMAAETISGLPNFYEERVDFFATSEMQPALQLWSIEADGSNLQRLTPGLPTRLQHPTLLPDGRIVATGWEMAFRRRIHNGFSLVEMGLDGRGFQQYSHRHQRMSTGPHFASAFPGNTLCAIEYYNGQTYGFGSLLCSPGDPSGPDFSDEPLHAWSAFLASTPGTELSGGVLAARWNRPFGQFLQYLDLGNRQERVGSRYLTPHMSNFDTSTPDWSGRVTQATPGANGEMFLVWSRGGVNRAEGGGLPADAMPRPDAGIYRVATGINQAIVDPYSQLERVIDSLEFHEMWPRPLVAWAEMHGAAPPLPAPPTGAPYGWLEAASIRARLTRPDGIDYARGAAYPETAWHTQGTEAGLTSDDDLVGVRVLAVVPEGLSRPFSPDFPGPTQYQQLNRSWWSPALDRIVILGEVPVLKRQNGALLIHPEDFGNSGQPQPDTSYRIRVPAGVAIFQQGLDRRGLATSTETTWHSLVPDEHKRCTGCHVRTQETPTFSASVSGQNAHQWVDVADQTPLFAGTDGNGDPYTQLQTRPTVEIEWGRDVAPILAEHCQSCHQGAQAPGGLVLDASVDTYRRLAVPVQDEFELPQVSAWTRMMQARQSRLAWYLWGERLDGRADAGDPDGRGGFDWTFDRAQVRQNHPPADLSATQRLTVARWIDIGMPIDLAAWHQQQDPVNASWKSRRGYLGDELPPTLVLGGLPAVGSLCAPATLRVGYWDDGGFDLGALDVRLNGGSNLAGPVHGNGAQELTMPAMSAGRHELVATLFDAAGNRSQSTRTLVINGQICPPAQIHRDGFE